MRRPLTPDPTLAKAALANPAVASSSASYADAQGPITTRGLANIAQRTALETLLLDRLDDEKAQDIVFIDLAGQSSVADGLIIASGRSQRHVGAMADHLLRMLKDQGYGKAKVEGMPGCDWVLIDVGDVIVHLFRPEVRGFYNIEKIWSVDSGHRGVGAN